jgi:hypothetical protein
VGLVAAIGAVNTFVSDAVFVIGALAIRRGWREAQEQKRRAVDKPQSADGSAGGSSARLALGPLVGHASAAAMTTAGTKNPAGAGRSWNASDRTRTGDLRRDRPAF